MRLRLHNVIYVVPVGLLVFLLVLFYERGVLATDTLTYLAAGERLNAGHQLYALGPGDRLVYLMPPLWTVPLVSPPLVAVLWRPLAVLPADAGLWLWWALDLAAFAVSVVMLAARKPGLTAITMLALVFPTAFELAVGNMNAMLLLGLLMTWRSWASGTGGRSGTVAMTMAALKLTPAILVWWVVVTRGRQAVVATVATGALLGALSVVGAGIAAHATYLQIITSPDTLGIYPLSLAGIAVRLGAPDGWARLLPQLWAGLGIVLVWLLRSRPTYAYATVVMTMLLGAPAVSINWYVLAYALLAPLAWPATPAPATGSPDLRQMVSDKLGAEGGDQGIARIQ